MVLFMPVDVDLDGVELSKTQLLNKDNSVQQIKEVKNPKASKKKDISNAPQIEVESATHANSKANAKNEPISPQ